MANSDKIYMNHVPSTMELDFVLFEDKLTDEMVKMSHKAGYLEWLTFDQIDDLSKIARGKLIWQNFIYPYLQLIGGELDVDPQNLVSDVYAWLRRFCEDPPSQVGSKSRGSDVK